MAEELQIASDVVAAAIASVTAPRMRNEGLRGLKEPAWSSSIVMLWLECGVPSGGGGRWAQRDSAVDGSETCKLCVALATGISPWDSTTFPASERMVSRSWSAVSWFEGDSCDWKAERTASGSASLIFPLDFALNTRRATGIRRSLV